MTTTTQQRQRKDDHDDDGTASLDARQRALADALAGVIASLVSLWAFYPVDVYKTHLQASLHSNNNNNNNNNTLFASPSSSSSSPLLSSNPFHQKFLYWFQCRQPNSTILRQFFKGLHVKSWHTIASNFCYFYLESWMTSRWIKQRNNQRQRQQQKQTSQPQQQQQKQRLLSPWEHLIVSALAAMLNTFLTLPLDVISLQSQIGVHDDDDDNNNNNNNDDNNKKKKNDDDVSIRKANKNNNHKINNNNNNNESQNRNASSSPPSRQHPSADYATPSSSTSSSSSSSQGHFIMMDQVWNSLSFDQELDNTACHETTYFDCLQQPNDASKQENDVQEEKKDDRIIAADASSSSSSSSAPLPNNTNNSRSVLSSPLLVHPSTKYCLSTSVTTTTTTTTSFASMIIDAVDQFRSLWKGLIPSLLLCTNPSIHYTVYDLIKNYHLARFHNHQHHHHHLTWAQAFWAGVLAKLTATLITYPLIRAKVLLIMKQGKTSTTTTTTTTTKCNHDDDDDDVDDDDNNEHSSNSRGPSSTGYCSSCNNNNHQHHHQHYRHGSLVQCLMEQYQLHGLPGWYRGCSIQILHTVLKSALIMMVREHITDWVRHGWFLFLQKRHRLSSISSSSSSSSSQ